MRVSVLLEMLTGQFETDLKRAEKNFAKSMKDMERTAAGVGQNLADRVNKIRDRAIAVATAALSGGALAIALRDADKIDEVAERLGTTAEALSKLRFAAEQSGASFQALQNGFARLAREAATGGKNLEKLGISALDSAGKLRPLEDVFGDVADKVASYTSGADRLAAAQSVFGRGAAELAPLLALGSRGIQELGERAERLGLVIRGDTAAAAAQLFDNLDALRVAGTGLALTLGNELLPSLVSATEATLELVESLRADGTLDAVAQGFSTVIGLVDELAILLAGALAGKGIAAIVAMTTSVAAAGAAFSVTAVAAKAWAGVIALLGGPIVAATVAITALTLGAYKAAQAFPDVEVAGIRVVQFLAQSFTYLKESVLIVWSAISAAAQGAFNNIRTGIADVIASNAQMVESFAAIGSIQIAGREVFSGISEGAERVAGVLRQIEAAVRPTTSAYDGFVDAKKRIVEETGRELAANASIFDSMIEDAFARGESAAAAAEQAKAIDVSTDSTGRFDVATKAAAKTMEESEAAARQYKDAIEELGRASSDVASLQERLIDATSTPMQRVQQQWDEARAAVERYRVAVLAVGPPDPAVQAGLDALLERTDRFFSQELANADPAVQAAQRASQEWQRYWSGALDSVSRAFGDFVASGFESLSDFGRSLRRIAQQIISDLVAQFARQRIVIPIAAALGGGSGSALAGVGQGINGGGLGQIFGGITQGGGLLGGFLNSTFGAVGGAIAGLGGTLGSFGAGLTLAGNAGLAAATQFGALQLAAGNVAVGLGAMLPGIGLAVGAFTALRNVLRTRWERTGGAQEFNVDASGGSGRLAEDFIGRRRFRSDRRETRFSALDAEAEAAIDGVFQAARTTLSQAARILGRDVPEIIGGSFRRAVDAQGNVIEEASTVLGVRYVESFERFAQRLSAENVIGLIDQAMSGAGDAVEGAVSAIAQRWRADAEQLADGAQFLLAAFADIQRGVGLLGDGTLSDVADLIEDLANDGESLTAAYARVAASTLLLENVLSASSVTLDKTREDFVRFATEIAEAAGGLERAQSLWNSYYETFFTAAERAAIARDRALSNAGREFEDIGLNVSDFAGDGGAQRFRELFEERLPSLSAAAVVEWLEAAEALGIFIRASDAAGQSVQTLSGFMAGIDEQLAEFRSPQSLAEQFAELDTWLNETLQRAIELGATEEDLARIRELGALRAQELRDQEAEIVRSRAELADTLAVLAAESAGGVTPLTERMRQLRGEYDQHVARINELARASGRASASAAELAMAQRWYQVQVSRAVAELVSQAQGLIQRLYGRGGRGGGQSAPLSGGRELGNIGEINSAVEDRYRRELELLGRLRDFIDSLALSDLSPLTPQERLNAAESAFNSTVAAVNAGDLDALERLPEVAREYLRESQGFFGGVGQFPEIFARVRGILEGIQPREMPGGGTPVGGGGGGGMVVEAGDSFERLSELERFGLASELTTILRDVMPALRLDLAGFAEQFGIDLEQYLADLGVNLDQLTVTSATRMADIARALGVELGDLAQSVGVDLGGLADRQGLLNDALEGVIGNLPEEFRGRLQGLLQNIEDATTEADARSAIAAAEAEIESLPPFIRDALAPFFEGISSPTDDLLQTTLAQAEMISGVRQDVASILEILQGEQPPATPDFQVESKGEQAIVISLEQVRAEIASLRAEQRARASEETREMSAQTQEIKRLQGAPRRGG